MRKRKIIVAITGASGSIYAKLLVEELARHEDIDISLIISDNGSNVMRYEDSDSWIDSHSIKILDNKNMFSAMASGSANYEAMVIVPCSMGTLGKIASGIADNLICRSADVMIKERRTLIIVPRESPMNTIHLRNLVKLSECGTTIVPASPSFYSKPETITDLCKTITERILTLLNVETEAFEWGNNA